MLSFLLSLFLFKNRLNYSELICTRYWFSYALRVVARPGNAERKIIASFYLLKMYRFDIINILLKKFVLGSMIQSRRVKLCDWLPSAPSWCKACFRSSKKRWSYKNIMCFRVETSSSVQLLINYFFWQKTSYLRRNNWLRQQQVCQKYYNIVWKAEYCDELHYLFRLLSLYRSIQQRQTRAKKLWQK